VNLENPIRFPDASSTVIMNKRAWWLILLGFLMPGSPQALAGNQKLGRFGLVSTFTLWALAVLFVALCFVAPEVTFGVLTQGVPLLIIQWLLIAYAVLWVILTLNTFRLVKFVKLSSGAKGVVSVMTAAALVFSAGAFAYASSVIGSTRTLISDVFVAAPPVDPVDGRYNFLLLGADAGADRDGLRPDSVTVVSVDATTGQAVMIGIPRELEYAPFPETSPMHAIHPNGYASEICLVDVCKFNSIYTDVEINHADLYPNSAARGSSPGIDALMEAASGVTGLTVQFYVLIDMQGFATLVDALGGVEIDVPERVGLAPADWVGEPMAWVEPGVQVMNGELALYYARTRWNTTDWDRMKRQRLLQEAIIRQFSPTTVITKFQEIASAGAQVVQTDIPEGMIAPLVTLARKTTELPITTVELIPENGVDSQYPDYAIIHEMVRAAVTPPPPTSETPEAS
jgi:LCP family protein required for cell wall assembly